jgi:arylformamidase
MNPPDDLERQYNARLSIPEHPEIFARWAERSREARDALPCVLDVAYDEGPGRSGNATLDVFPAEGRSRALLMYIHGGYWRSLDKGDFSFLAPAFRAAGVTLAVVNYALAPTVSVSHIVRQMLLASAWLWRTAGALGADRDRMFVAGHSAGAHLAAMMLAAQWPRYAADLPADLFKGGLAVSGIYDLQPLLAVSVNQDLRLDAREAERLSVAYMPPATGAPLSTAVGGLESAEFKRQNALIGECWKSCLRRDIAMPGFNHLTVAAELGNPASPLFAGALDLIEAR